ncbi:MAG TPA: hypothetical protein VK563_17740 [Puia sp.]|nr:hypothetical protein [Puia sp.]
MKVWNNSWYSKDLIEAISYAAPVFITELTRHFENRAYGKGVNEVFYIEVCENPIFGANNAGTVLYYEKGKTGVQDFIAQQSQTSAPYPDDRRLLRT